jgi:hypothetical protein
MRVVLAESIEGSGQEVRDQLVAAGHEVVECFEPGEDLCVGAGHAERCPYAGTVDVAVAVRIPGDGPIELREMGAVCSLNHHVPLVEFPGLESSPFAAYSTHSSGDVVGAIEAVAGTAPFHAAAATEALRGLPVLRDYEPESVFATARRDGDRLQLTLTLPPGLTGNQIAQATTWAARAVRDLDPHARTIDLGIAH